MGPSERRSYQNPGWLSFIALSEGNDKGADDQHLTTTFCDDQSFRSTMELAPVIWFFNASTVPPAQDIADKSRLPYTPG